MTIAAHDRHAERYKWTVRILSLLLFAIFFVLARLAANIKFPAHTVATHYGLPILAWSIYVAVLCGLAVLMMDLVRVAFKKRLLTWVLAPWAFVFYVLLTVLPVVVAPFYVGEQAMLLIGLDTSHDIDVQRALVVHNLERAAPIIVSLYFVADIIAFCKARGSPYLLGVDGIVLVIHLAALTGLAAAIVVPDQASDIQQMASAWIIGGALLFQNLAFALITSLDR